MTTNMCAEKLFLTATRKFFSINRMSSIWLLLCGFLFTLFVFSADAYAQVTTGSIFGSVKDPSGAYVANAAVKVENPSVGITRNTTTSEDGNFVIPNLLPGTYILVVEATGFKRFEKTDLVLSAADRLNAGVIDLEVGAVTESVQVQAESGELQLKANSGERSELITNAQINNLALNGRNILDFTKIVPGVVSSFNGAFSGTGGIDAFNINGTRANQHEFTIDGASNVDTGNNGGTHVTLNPDAIEEVKILTSNYQAEYGKAAGGQIAITTKGGTNEFHGNGRFFHRHEGLNANNWFANRDGTERAKYRYNYFGYQIGGPVIIPGTNFNKNRDRLFFFWNQEFYQQLVPVGGTINFYTPTQLERQGDFTQSRDGDGRPIIIAGAQVVNNRIDRNLLSPARQAVFDQVQKILNLYPLPNVTGRNDYNYSTTISSEQPRREDILRIDYQINEKNRLFGRWINNSDKQTGPILPWPGFGTFACAGAINFPGGCASNHPGWNLAFNLASTISSNIVNEFSIGPSFTKTRSESVDGNISLGKNNINLPLLYPVDADQSIPDMGFGGLPGVNFGWTYLGATPWFQKNTTINVNDNLTWVKGDHVLKFGGFYQRSAKDQVAWGNVNGQFNFDTSPTSGGTCPGGAGTCTLGNPYASALLGEFQNFSQSTARPVGYFRYNQVEFYAQDTWKMNKRLTLDYGMRFSWIPPQYDAQNQVAVFDPNAYDPAKAVSIDPNSGNIIPGSGDPLNGMLFTKDGTLPKGGWSSSGILPEPRVGFAFDPFSDHKTVFRGGFGVMHDRTQGNLIFNTVFNNPAVVKTPSVSGANIVDLPTLGAAAAEGITSPLTNIFGAERNAKVPTVYSYSLSVQRNLGLGFVLDVAYVGTLGRHLVTSRDINAIPYGYAFTREAQDPNCSVFGGGGVPDVEPGLPAQFAAAGYNFTGQCALGRNSYTNAPLVPYKGYGQISYLRFDGTSNYNSMQVTLQRRFSKGFTVGAAYTWSKTLTTANSDQDMQDPFDVRGLNYRAAGWDRTHVLVINYVYDIPDINKHLNGPSWVSAITRGFQISGITQFMTGTPIELNNGWSFESGAIDGSNMWGAIPYYITVDANGEPVAPKIGPPIQGSRDFFRNGGMQNWDMSLFKNIGLWGEGRYLQLRVEAFNVFNQTNFHDKRYNVNVDGPWQWASPATPITISKGSGWGEYTSQYSGTGGPRVIQLGVKLYF